MTGRSWAALFCKVLALYVAITLLNNLSYYSVLPSMMGRAGAWEIAAVTVSFLVPAILMAWLGYFLWTRAEYLSLRLTGGSTGEEKGMSPVDAQIIAFTTVGLFVLVMAIPEIFHNMYSLYALRDAHMTTFEEWSNIGSLGNMIESALKLVIGLWLLFGSRSIVFFLRSLRRAGLKNEE
ncbi:MAG: hypothetical protein JL50_17020 [Peptococcaceae bacterium BICA1-7]|nr:MAG: hypothetical protein JL50_17020 [Peptococcaceae bacterium BICA1-7]HBV96504.1 hypothetical protein [Desulfotomaculum sp.]